MFTKLNSAYTKFKNNININKAIEPNELQGNHVVIIAFAVINLAALVRVLYAGYTGR